jgi:hypothetical protein
MARRKDHFKAFSICPHCLKPARVRRNGVIKHHRIPIWDEETKTGRTGRCPGVGRKNTVEMAWKTYEDAERGLDALRGTLKKPMPEAIEEETIAPGDVEAAVDKAFEEEFFN